MSSIGFCKQKMWAITSLLAPLALAVAPAVAQQKPNILVIMGDDVGWYLDYAQSATARRIDAVRLISYFVLFY